jgi:hypothetical protein
MTPSAAPSRPATLDLTYWRLATVDGVDISTTSPLDLWIDPGRGPKAGGYVFGTAPDACAPLKGRYDGDHEQAEMTFRWVEVACDQEPALVLNYLRALRATRTWSIVDRALRLEDTEEVVRLVFHETDVSPLPPLELVRSWWSGPTVNGGPPPDEHGIGIQFDASGTVGGGFECNGIFGTYEVHGSTIRIQAISSLMDCMTDGPDLLGVVNRADRWQIVDGRLRLYSGDAQILELRGLPLVAH